MMMENYTIRHITEPVCCIFLLGTLRPKDGVKVFTDLDPGGHARKFSHTSVELGKDFIIQLHHFLHCLLSHCYGGFLQTCH